MRILIVTLALVSLSSVPRPMIGQVMLLDPDLPSVSIHLEEKASRTGVRSGESNEGILLRLYNNTTVPIAVCAYDSYLTQSISQLSNGQYVNALSDGREISLCYSVESERESAYYPVKRASQGDTYSDPWVPSGSSVLFFVPENYLGGYWRVSVRFTYEWDQGGAWPWDLSAVSHQVFYSFRDLLRDFLEN